MTIYELIHFKKIVRVWKLNHYYVVKMWPTNRFSKANSYNFHFHKNDITWPLSANGLFESRVDLAIVENILSPTLSLMLYMQCLCFVFVLTAFNNCLVPSKCFNLSLYLLNKKWTQAIVWELIMLSVLFIEHSLWLGAQHLLRRLRSGLKHR